MSVLMDSAELTAEITAAVDAINSKRGTSYGSLKPLQFESVKKALQGDTISVLPTGYGKSLVFEIVQKITGKTAILCSPLNSIIEEQTARYGSEACRVSSTVLKSQDFSSCNFNFIIGHPEELLQDDVLQAFRNEQWQNSVGHIIIDEAHCVVSWGANFREKFTELCRLRSLFPAASFLCLTATATKEMRNSISKALGLVNVTMTVGQVNRDNIKLTVRKRPPITGGNNTSEESFEQVLDPYVAALIQDPRRAPRTVIYCKLKYCGLGYEYAVLQGDAAGVNLRPFVSQYHAPCMQEVKSAAVKDLQRLDGSVRLLFATEAYSMGTDAPNIRKIVHIGVPYNMEAYVQEVGRAGRDGKLAEAILYYNNNDIGANVKDLKQVMREYCRTPSCRKAFINEHFGIEGSDTRVAICCDNCDIIEKDYCDITEDDSQQPTIVRQKNEDLYDVLCNYFDCENAVVTSMPNSAIATGLTRDLAHDLSLQSSLQEIDIILEEESYLQDHYKDTIYDIAVQLL